MKVNTIFCLLVSLFLSWASQTYSQKRHPRFSPEEFKAQIENYIATHASLSAAEAQKFFPLYHELRGKQRELNHQMMKLKRGPLAVNAKDKTYYDMLLKISKLKEESAQLESTYFKRMCKAIPARKVFEAINAEDSFHRNMLKRFGRNNNPKSKR